MTDIKEAQGLEVVASLHQHFDGRRRVQVPNGVYDQDAGWGAKVEPLCRLSDATAVIDQLRAENAELKSKMSGVDERVVFEAAYLKANYPRVAAGELSAPPIFGRVGSMKFHGQAEGDYECSDVQTCWVIWQARAAIPMVIPNGYALVPAQPQSDVHPLCRERLRIEGKAYPRSGCEVCGKWSPKSDKCRALLGGSHDPAL